MPLLTKYQGKGLMKGLLFDNENKERIIIDDDLTVTARHFFTLLGIHVQQMAVYGLKAAAFY